MKMKKTETTPQVRIRAATEEDVNFIFNSWLKSFRDSAFARNITDTVYFDQHHKVLEDLLKSCDVLIACNNINSGEIYGYIVTERVSGIFVTHFAYTKHLYRGLGIAKSLFKEAGADFSVASVYTHSTKSSERYAEKYNLVHNPYVALLAKYRSKEEAKDEQSDSN